jgi:hypothetical protein
MLTRRRVFLPPALACVAALSSALAAQTPAAHPVGTAFVVELLMEKVDGEEDPPQVLSWLRDVTKLQIPEAKLILRDDRFTLDAQCKRALASARRCDVVTLENRASDERHALLILDFQEWGAEEMGPHDRRPVAQPVCGKPKVARQWRDCRDRNKEKVAQAFVDHMKVHHQEDTP